MASGRYFSSALALSKDTDDNYQPITEIALESWLRDLFRRTPDASPSQTPPQITRSLTIVRRKVSGPRDPAHVRPLSTPDVEQLVLAAISNDNIDGNLAFQKAVDSMLKSHPSVVTTLVNDWFAACEKSVNLAIQPGRAPPHFCNNNNLLKCRESGLVELATAIVSLCPGRTQS